jgi:formylglycine-generating enzyme required for sulfatase activity
MRVPGRIRLGAGLLSISLLCGSVVLGGYWDLQKFKRGDANGDGSLDIGDALRILGHLFLAQPPELDCQDAADANDDGEVDIGDPILILFFLFAGNGVAIPPPFPECGRDLTEDWLSCAKYGPCGRPSAEMSAAGMELVYIPPGIFLMGSPRTERDRRSDEILHEVVITRGFYMGATEVTQAQYMAVMGKYYDCAACRDVCVTSSGDYPVIKVCWNDAVAFCRKLSELEGRPYRLPTEAEWEYACRAGTMTRFWFGDALDLPEDCPASLELKNRDLYECNYWPVPVGRKKSNPWGLYDIHDNAAEWCSDWYAAYPKERVIDPQGPRLPTGLRVLRADGSLNGPPYGRSAARWGWESTINCGSSSGCNPGFRVVLQVFPPPYPR